MKIGRTIRRARTRHRTVEGVDEPTPRRRHAGLLSAVIALALLGAIWLQRGTVTAAIGELGGLGRWTLLLLVGLVAVDRLVRGLTIRRAIGGLTRVEGVVMHEVGAAASYGLPGGGMVGTGLRYHVARTASVDGSSFLAGLTAYGVAISAASWFLPLGLLTLEVGLGHGSLIDLALIGICVAVLVGSALFWWFVIRSDRLLDRVVRIGQWFQRRLARRWTSLGRHDLRAELGGLRVRLRAAVPQLPVLVVGAVAMQLIAASILFVALSGLDVTSDIGMLEFGRIFFVTRVLSTLAPTPGGVGVVEAGMSAGLAAAGIPAAAAVAGVLVFRLATYIVPIVSGAVLWMVWRQRPVATVPEAVPSELAGAG